MNESLRQNILNEKDIIEKTYQNFFKQMNVLQIKKLNLEDFYRLKETAKRSAHPNNEQEKIIDFFFDVFLTILISKGVKNAIYFADHLLYN